MLDEPKSRRTPELFMTEIHVRDWSAAVAWYTSILGLDLLLKDEVREFALLGGGTARLALKKQDPRSRPTSSAVRLVFRVDDLLSERAQLIAAGVAVGPVEEVTRENYQAARLFDPEGTPITLFAWTARPPDMA